MKSFKEYRSGSRLKTKTSDWEGRDRLSKKVRGDFWKSFKKQKREELGPDADAGDYVDDFRKSDAPQFKGKTDKKIQKMAIAAYLKNKEKKISEYHGLPGKQWPDSDFGDKNTIRGKKALNKKLKSLTKKRLAKKKKGIKHKPRPWK